MQYNDITFYLGIKDKEMKIIDQYYEIIDGRTAKVVKIQRNQVATSCPRCGKKTKRVHDYRNQKIKHTKLCDYDTYIIYRKRRYVCMDCNKRFYEPNRVTPKYGKLSSHLKLKILQLLKKKVSMTDIGDITNVSTSTVLRTLKSLQEFVSNHRTLPEVICMDEFRSVKNVGNYSFIMGDPTEGKIIDILPNRFKKDLLSYFRKIDIKERRKVKYVIMDAWTTYRDVAKAVFPNAIIIADRFHYIRQIYWAFNAIRIKVQDQLYKTNRRIYNIMKKNWKALIAYSKNLNGKQPFYSRQYKRYVTVFDIIDDCLQASDELAHAYALKEQFYDIVHTSTYETIETDLTNYSQTLVDSGLPEYNGAITAFTNWKQEIINSFIINEHVDRDDNENYYYTNGYIEGLNNFIKVIKRVAFGYRNFDNFKTRILYIHNNKNKNRKMKKVV